MGSSTVEWLGRLGWGTFVVALAGLLIVNGAAIAAWIARRDRELVRRWVAPWLAANLLIVFVGVAVPAVTSAARLAILLGNTGTSVTAARAIVTPRPAD